MSILKKKHQHHRASQRTILIRWKLIGSFTLVVTIMFSMNAVIFGNIDHMLSRVEEVYTENISINVLIDEVSAVQNAMTDYLNTKNSDAMEDYYKSEEELRKSLSKLHVVATDQPTLLMEKNIYYMSATYLDTVYETIQSKRGRLIEKYKVSYQKATILYDYLNNYLYSLNNEQFIYNTQSSTQLLDSFRTLEYLTVILLAFICIGMLFMIIQLTRSIIQPLSTLAKAANEVASGNLDMDQLSITRRDEVGVVAKAFNQMIISLQTYIAQIKYNMEVESLMKEKELKMEAHLKDAKLKYLQAQIQPHFLFNTLNAGAQLAMMEEADRTYEYIQNVASFYRYNISLKEENVTLKEEIDLIDNYIYILNVRYSNEIKFTKSIEDEVLDIKIPRMVLQPIVENAVKYGILASSGEGEVQLVAKRKEDHILLCVIDNGVGISQEEIQRIQNCEEKGTIHNSDSNGVGLINVKHRLWLSFGNTDSLKIESDGRGTKVMIRIPKIE